MGICGHCLDPLPVAERAGAVVPAMTDKRSGSSIELLRKDREFSAVLCGHSLRFCTTWGLFSPRDIDVGSRMLLDVVEVRDGDRILDLGCGYGALGVALAKLTPTGTVSMVDKDFVAVDYAQKNAHANRLHNVRASLSNGLQHVEQQDFDLVVTNLPAKSGKELYYIMFHDVHRLLRPGGSFYIVTITGLRRFVQRAFVDVFGNYRKVRQGQTYTVAMARRCGAE